MPSSRLGYSIGGLFAVGLLLGAGPALAQDRVGRAEIVRNDVSSQRQASVIRISAGDAVARNDLVRTGVNSDTKLVLLDSTNVSLGPNSSLRLDRAVLADSNSYSALAIRLASGAFRFMTGNSAKRAYTINTPIATIGVRGTTLDIRVRPVDTTVVLQDGQATVCAIGGACVQLLVQGDTAVVTTQNGQTRTTKLGSPPWDFGGACAANAALCTQTQLAGLQNVIDDVIAALCGR